MPRSVESKSKKWLSSQQILKTTRLSGHTAGGTLHIRWKVLLIYAVVTVASFWLLIASSIYFFVKINTGYTDVRYSQILGLPFTLSAYRKSKGEFFINQGLIAAQESRWRDAFDLLRIGLPAHPDHEEGRLTLARIYLMARRPDQAKNVFLEGLNHGKGDQTDYIRTVLTFLFNQQADSTVVEITDNLIGTDRIDRDLQNTLLVARLFAYFNRDQFEKAKLSVKGTAVETSLQAKIIDARIAWETGLKESSLLILRDLHKSNPADDEVYRTLQNYLQEQGLFNEGRRLALNRQIAYPQRPDAYLDFMALCEEDAMKPRRDATIDEFLRIFATDATVLLRFQSMAADRGWNKPAWRVAELLGNKTKKDKIAAVILAIEADISAGDYATAIQNATREQEVKEPLSESERMSLLGLVSIADLGRGMTTEGESNLNRVLSTSMIPPSVFVALGKHLQTIYRPDLAERAFARAYELDLLNQTAVALLLEIRLNRNALEDSLELVERLTEMRKPKKNLMLGLFGELNSDRYLYLEKRGQAIDALEKRMLLIDLKAN